MSSSMLSHICISYPSFRRNNSNLRVDRVRYNIRFRSSRHVHSLQVRNNNKDSEKVFLGLPRVNREFLTFTTRAATVCGQHVSFVLAYVVCPFGVLIYFHPLTFSYMRATEPDDDDRQMKLNNELNNMSWRVRPDEVLLEVGRLFGSKMGLQKLNYEVDLLIIDFVWESINIVEYQM